MIQPLLDTEIKDKVLDGGRITPGEAKQLYFAPLTELGELADARRRQRKGAAYGGRGNDIGTLKVGEFYFSSEGSAAPEKLKTLLCLSHHAQNPLSHQEVVKRAHEGGGSADTE